MSKSSISVLAKAISSKNGLTAAEAERFIQKMFDVANAAIDEDKQLKVRWLGTFKVTSVKDRESVDVNTGDRIVIEGRDKITFTPDNILKEIVNKPFAQFETVVVNDGVDFSDIDQKFADMEKEEIEASAEEADAPMEEVPAETVVEEVPVEEHVVEDAPVKEAPVEEATAEIHVSSSAAAQDVASQFLSSENSAEDLVAKVEESVDEEQVENTLVADSSVADCSVTKTPIEESHITETSDEDIPEEIAPVEKVSVDESPVEKVTAEEASVPENPTVTTSASSTHVSENSVASAPGSETLKEEVTASASHTPTPVVEVPIQQNVAPQYADDDEETANHHFMIPKYVVAIVCLIFVALLGGMGWFAFNYGKMQAQRDHLATQLEGMKSQASSHAPVKKNTVVAPQDSTELALQEKARQDSIRMAAAHQAIQQAEEAELAEKQSNAEKAETSAKAGQNTQDAKSLASSQSQKDSKLQQQAKAQQLVQSQKNAKTQSANASKASAYDNDPRVRTGAYLIVGVAQTVTVKAGQTLASLSKTYLGPGMECYVEAVNGTSEVKAGQKLKIPKLELKKRK